MAQHSCTKTAMSEPTTSSPGTTWHRVRRGHWRRQASVGFWVHVMRFGHFDWTIRVSDELDAVDEARAGGSYGSRGAAMREADALFFRDRGP